jgi:tRNA A-37 threonylcarbamoyl transferase component Bud32
MILAEGTMVDGYRIVRAVDHGGSAVVYEAFDTGLRRPVALKMLHRERNRHEIPVKRFEKEAWIHGSLVHPNIVPVYRAKQSRYGRYIAMQLMQGNLAEKLLGGRPLDPELSLRVLGQVAAALDFAHERETIHRDVKPGNILFDERGTAFLSDFGITKNLAGTPITRTGGGPGTPDYMAPEQRHGEDVTRRADVYSLAVVLFECLTGSIPVPAGPYFEEMAVALGVHASERNSALSPAIDTVLERGMAEDPEERFEKASILVAEAEEALTAPGPASSTARPPAPASLEVEPEPGPPTTPARSPRSLPRRSLVWMLAALMLGLAGLAAGRVSGESSASPPAKPVRAGGVYLEVPSSWAVEPGEADVPGLALRRPVAAVAPDGESSLTVGTSKTFAPSLLPGAYIDQLKGATRKAVSLAGFDAYRYSNLVSPEGRELVIFAVPTSSGVILLACRLALPGSPSPLEACNRAGASMRLREVTPFPLGPFPQFADVLRDRIEALRRKRAKARGNLADAARSEAQAAAAYALARAYRRAAEGTAKVEVSPQSMRGKRAVLRAMDQVRESYLVLGDAARLEDADGFRFAKREIRAAEGKLNSSLWDLRSLGYQVG